MEPEVTCPDGGWGWVVVMAAFFINFVMDGVRYSFGILYMEFHNNFHGGRGDVGWIGGIMFGLLLTLAPISGSLVDKFGCRNITMAGSGIAALGFFLSWFATGIFYLCMTLGVLGGIGFSMMFMAAYMVLIQYFDKRRSLAIGLAVSGSGLGGFAFSPLTYRLLQKYTWRGTLLLISGELLHCVLCGAFMRPLHAVHKKRGCGDTIVKQESGYICQPLIKDSNQMENASALNNEHMHIKNREESCVNKDKMPDYVNQDIDDRVVNHERIPLTHIIGDSVNNDKRHKCTKQNKTDNNDDKIKHIITQTKIQSIRKLCSKIFVISLLKNRRFIIFLLVEVCINISYMVPFMYVADMALVNIADVTLVDVVWLLNSMSIANVASRVPVGILADRRCIPSSTLMGFLCITTGVACVLMPFSHKYWMLMVTCVVYSASIVSAMVLIPIVLGDYFGDDVIANSFGMSLFCGGVAGMIGTPLAGSLYDVTGTYTVSFLMAGVQFTVGGVLLFLIQYVHPVQQGMKE